MKQTSKIFTLILVFLLGIFLLFMGCTRQSTSQDTLVIGSILPLTGPASFAGGEMMNGMLLAVEELNAQGGIAGKQIQLFLEDSETKATSGVSAFHKMETSKEQPLLYISALSSVSMALAPLAEETRVSLMGLAVTAPDFVKNKIWSFRYYATAKDEIPPIISMLDGLDASTLGILYINDDYGLSVSTLLKTEFEKLSGLTKTETFQVSDSDFKTQILKLQNMDALYIVGFDSHLKIIIQQLRTLGYKGYILAPSTASLPTVRTTAGANKIYVAAPTIYQNGDVLSTRFKIAYQEKYKLQPTHYAANGYDLILFLEYSLRNQESLTRASLQKIIESDISYVGVFGKISSTQEGHERSFSLSPAQIIDGNLVYL